MRKDKSYGMKEEIVGFEVRRGLWFFQINKENSKGCQKIQRCLTTKSAERGYAMFNTNLIVCLY